MIAVGFKTIRSRRPITFAGASKWSADDTPKTPRGNKIFSPGRQLYGAQQPPAAAGLKYGMPSASPRKINSAASRTTPTGIAARNCMRHDCGNSRPESPIPSIIGNVPSPKTAI